MIFSACVPSIRFGEQPIHDKYLKAERTDTIPALTNSSDKEYEATGEKSTGICSYYGRGFDGRKTASGEKLDNDEFTGAHRTLPFGTKVKVTNLKNNKSCIVTITDRGPWKRKRIIDVTLAAAKELDMIRSGLCEVEVEVLKGPDGELK
jgi:rare lipoprotein A